MGLLLIVLAILGALIYRASYSAGTESAQVGIVAPDGMPDSEPRLQVWLDAAREEGLLAGSVHLSELAVKVFGNDLNSRFRVLILPDQILEESNGALLGRLQDYVKNGGTLLVCFDAWTRTGAGRNAALSDLVGVNYGLYSSMGDDARTNSVLLGSQKDFSLLEIPPGKAMPFPESETGQLALTTYMYGFATYPHFVTEGEYSGRALLTSPSGSLIVGEKDIGRGKVMFVNLPLGYLKGRTDGLMLHSVLHRLAVHAGLPLLSPSPDGIGGLIFNVHVDANTSLPVFEEMDRRGLFSQGPFSFHFTVGPDAYKKGDGSGMDLDHSPRMQQWIRRFVERGDGIGNHGGWIHNYFGDHVGDADKRPEMISLLEKNDASLRRVVGRPIKEYSAPIGNQPEWVTEWIEKRGVEAYYFTGNSGMAPTRSYRDGILRTKKIWSFPILNYGPIASFEDASESDIPHAEMTKWLLEISDYVANDATVRTFYSHPPGFIKYFDSMQQWFDHTKALSVQGRFRWYTMEGMAEFLNRRELVNWREEDGNSAAHFSATHPVTLKKMTWALPKSRYGQPEVTGGNAQVRDRDDVWEVVAGDGKELKFNAPMKNAK